MTSLWFDTFIIWLVIWLLLGLWSNFVTFKYLPWLITLQKVLTETGIQKICFLSWQRIQFKKTLYRAILMTHREFFGSGFAMGAFKSLYTVDCVVVCKQSCPYPTPMNCVLCPETPRKWCFYTSWIKPCRNWDGILRHLDVVWISLWAHTGHLWSCFCWFK